MRNHRPPLVAVPTVLSALALVACAPGTATPPEPGDTAATTAATATEVSSLTPRVVLSHDDGLLTIDAATGETVAETGQPGFLRLNPAGDGRHVLVSGPDGFQVFDAGIWEQPHGDHSHFYEQHPALTDIVLPSGKAGHVITNAGRTSLFSDAEGASRTFTQSGPESLSEGTPDFTTHETGAAHHGVAVPLADGTLLTTVGTEEHRDTVRQVDGDEVLAETTDCPGVHGSAIAGEAVVFGCENGPVVFSGGEFRKVAVDTDYQRSGNMAAAPGSPIVLADHKTDPDAEQERPTQVALIDAESAELQLVELDSSYWFRSLARGPEGEALVLTYDGDLVTIDEKAGEIVRETPVVEPWEEKENWQEPGPMVQVAGDTAYVTDAGNNELVLVDLTEGDVTGRFELPVTPVEMAVVTGEAD